MLVTFRRQIASKMYLRILIHLEKARGNFRCDLRFAVFGIFV